VIAPAPRSTPRSRAGLSARRWARRGAGLLIRMSDAPTCERPDEALTLHPAINRAAMSYAEAEPRGMWTGEPCGPGDDGGRRRSIHISELASAAARADGADDLLRGGRTRLQGAPVNSILRLALLRSARVIASISSSET